jgi:hypothetical protein
VQMYADRARHSLIQLITLRAKSQRHFDAQAASRWQVINVIIIIIIIFLHFRAGGERKEKFLDGKCKQQFMYIIKSISGMSYGWNGHSLLRERVCKSLALTRSVAVVAGRLRLPVCLFIFYAAGLEERRVVWRDDFSVIFEPS